MLWVLYAYFCLVCMYEHVSVCLDKVRSRAVKRTNHTMLAEETFNRVSNIIY